uniref:Uncharacterized protein n=1 Tax=Steinernema glaseri TaxID=37863 RepID=A0A1I7Y4L3_9BILA
MNAPERQGRPKRLAVTGPEYSVQSAPPVINDMRTSPSSELKKSPQISKDWSGRSRVGGTASCCHLALRGISHQPLINLIGLKSPASLSTPVLSWPC